ncbi:hypothetical protein GCM10011608_10120 [Micromonospora sonchi]|uniref:Uncharacterized protein n=1 Tax=Micromonospora sonchi TaxID=1763543 RepID=A0A917WTS4_9ACTN|nr:hypothetical protein [Micromonospora sonchi]GGM27343.1 hypothetical protein GCM10011608_10120 [Micromonospora sonchi]
MQLTEAQRAALLDRAIEAMRDRLAAGPNTDPAEVTRRNEVARMAVTDAVTRAGHVHTLISVGAGCSGMQVVQCITDWSAQAEALRVERHAAARYVEQVREAIQFHARVRSGAQGRGAVSQIAKEIGVERKTVYAWIDQASDGE